MSKWLLSPTSRERSSLISSWRRTSVAVRPSSKVIPIRPQIRFHERTGGEYSRQVFTFVNLCLTWGFFTKVHETEYRHQFHHLTKLNMYPKLRTQAPTPCRALRLETLMTIRTHASPIAAKSVRVDNKTRAAQARLADKSFSAFVREHNARRHTLEG